MHINSYDPFSNQAPARTWSLNFMLGSTVGQRTLMLHCQLPIHNHNRLLVV
jgi:hypothetical protein